MLRREVACRVPDRVGVILSLVIVGIGATVATGLMIGPRRTACFGESKTDVASATVKKYAYEAYPSWVLSHPTEDCPPHLFALNEYMNNKDILDPWGTSYELYCGARGIIVHSLGEDSVRNTADDIWSNL